MNSNSSERRNGRVPGDTGGEPSTLLASKPAAGLAALDLALEAWTLQGKGSALLRWLNRELDQDGVPRTLPVEEWEEGLRPVFAARKERPHDWAEEFDALVEGWFRATLRFARPGGIVSASRSEPEKARALLYRGWADSLSDPGLATVVDWWFPRTVKGRHSPPPLPADARPDRALAVLRANWSRDGDFLSVDHRVAGSTTKLELFGAGIPWLGSSWDSVVTHSESSTRARPTLWLSQSSADVFEWAYRVGNGRVIRSVVLLRGRKLAILGEQWEGSGDPGGFSIDLAEGVQATSIPECRGLVLKHDRGRGSARVIQSDYRGSHTRPIVGSSAWTKAGWYSGSRPAVRSAAGRRSSSRGTRDEISFRSIGEP